MAGRGCRFDFFGGLIFLPVPLLQQHYYSMKLHQDSADNEGDKRKLSLPAFI